MRHRLSRSYAVNLPSSLTGVLSRALEFSSRLPVSVCGTGTYSLARGFSRQFGVGQFALIARSSSSRLRLIDGGFAYHQPYTFKQTSISLMAYPPASPRRSNGSRWHWNFNQLSIAYAFRPQLRPRLTLRGRTFLRKP
jgi:hypothetical protein